MGRRSSTYGKSLYSRAVKRLVSTQSRRYQALVSGGVVDKTVCAREEKLVCTGRSERQEVWVLQNRKRQKVYLASSHSIALASGCATGMGSTGRGEGRDYVYSRPDSMEVLCAV